MSLSRSLCPLALLATALLAGPAAASAATPPVAAYGFEDAASSSTVGDASVYGNTGTIEGASRVAGRFGAGLSFDGVNDRVKVADSASLNLASAMTLEAWVNPSNTGGWRAIAVKERLVNSSYALYGSGDTTPGAFVSADGKIANAHTPDVLDLNAWSHVAATYDGSALRLYVNGVLKHTTTEASGPLIPGDGPLSIGGNGIWGEWFKGVIDELRVYDRSLTAAEIQADMTTPVGVPAGSAPGVPASTAGSWTAPQPWPLVAVHASMLSDGKVVAWDAFESALQSERVWDPATGTFVPTPSGINLFCSGHALLPDGRLFVAGGHELPYVGLPDTRLLNPLTGHWTAGPNMARGRWYPTTTTLPDGRVLIVSGDGIRPGPNDPFFVRPSDTIPEIYDPKTSTMKALPSAGRLMPLYPFMFVAPDGRVVDAGPDTTTRLLDTATSQWSTLTSRSPVTGGSAVMYRPGKILKTGSWTDTDFGNPPIVNGSAVLDLDQAVPAWRSVTPMKWARTYHTLTVMPDGQVLSLGGQARQGANDLYDSPVLQPELWNPDTDTWTPMASSVRPRGYHNTSLLLPDGRILLAGSGRLGGSLMIDETSAEIFSPPYLHRGPRPTISSAPGTMTYGGELEIESPEAAEITKVSLVRIGSVTHNFNMDQRWQELTFRRNGNTLEVDAPTSPNTAPPGVYYVFILDGNGVPSKAAIVSIAAPTAPDTAAPTVSVSSPATVRGSVTVSATASDDVGVAGVQFKLDGVSLGNEDVTAPFSTVWDSTAAAPGAHLLTAVARDAAGNTTTSAPVAVTVDNTAPAGPAPVAAYGFEEGSGATVADLSGRGHIGTIREAAWTTSGKNGKALSFDGTNDWVTIEDAADLRSTTGMTVEAWINPTKNNSWRTAVMKERSGELTWALYSAGQSKPSIHVGSASALTSGAAAPLNAWTHLAATYDGTTVRLYVNGTQTATAAQTNALGSLPGPLRLGGNSVWGEHFAGKLDDVRVYDRALTAAQIQADMTTPVGQPAAPDTVPPSAPQNLAATGALGKNTLAWSASTDNVGVTRYVVHRSTTSGFAPGTSTRIATVTSGTSYVDSGLAAGTYHYRVLAEDAAGNTSAPSQQASGTALADTTAPTTAITAPAAATTVRGSVAVTATAADDVGVAGVQFQLDGANLGSEDVTAPYLVTWDSVPVAPGPHVLTAVARDAAGNRTTSTPITVTVDNSTPSGPAPVAAYGFEEGTGTTVADATGKGHVGTIREAAWTTSGKNGKALSFDGVNDWVTIDDATDLRLVGAMTLEAWVRPSVVNGWRTVVMKERPGDLAWALYGAGDTRPSVYATAGSATASTALASGTWAHLAATYDATTIRLYVNGVQVASAARANALTAYAGALRLGGNGIWGEWFAGLIDDVRIYDVALSAQQIQADMARPVS